MFLLRLRSIKKTINFLKKCKYLGEKQISDEDVNKMKKNIHIFL